MQSMTLTSEGVNNLVKLTDYSGTHFLPLGKSTRIAGKSAIRFDGNVLEQKVKYDPWSLEVWFVAKTHLNVLVAASDWLMNPMKFLDDDHLSELHLR